MSFTDPIETIAFEKARSQGATLTVLSRYLGDDLDVAATLAADACILGDPGGLDALVDVLKDAGASRQIKAVLIAAKKMLR